MVKKRESKEFKKDSVYEGRDEYWIDLDRMTNEGLAGGTVTKEYGEFESIDESIDLVQEEPPSPLS